MKYTYKETVILAKKLKVFLAIFLLVLISSIGYISSQKAYSEPIINSGTIEIEENGNQFLISLTVNGNPKEGVIIHGSEGLLGTTNDNGELTFSSENIPNIDYIIIDAKKIYVEYIDNNHYQFSYEEPEPAYALLYENGTLVFQRGNTPNPELEYLGNVTEIFSDFENSEDFENVPWESYKSTIYNVMFNDTISPISTANWFGEMNNLNEITNIEKLDTSKTVDMTDMFYNTAIMHLDLSSFDTSNVTEMSGMFAHCRNLNYINLIGFDTSSVVNMAAMFMECESLDTLELFTFDTSNVENMDAMFNQCTNLSKIFVSDMWSTESIVNTDSIIFEDDQNLPNFDSNDTTINKANYIDGYLMYQEYIQEIYAHVYDSGIVVFTTNQEPNAMYGELLETATPTTFYKSDEITKIIIKCRIKLTGYNEFFYGMENLEEIEGIQKIDTSESSDFNRMFAGSQKLKEIDLSNFDMSNAENTTEMFSDISPDKIIFGTKNKFFDDTDLKGSWRKHSEFEENNRMLGSEIVNNYDGETMAGEYLNETAYALIYENGDMVFSHSKEADATRGEVIEKYEDIDNMYGNSTTPSWYNYMSDNQNFVKKIYINDEISPTSFRYFFAYCRDLDEIINIENINTSKATSMENMFYCCQSLTSLDLTNFDTSNVTNMSRMFDYCTTLVTIDLSYLFDTSNVTDMSQMFYMCYDLKNIDLRYLNTSKVTNMSGMFHYTGNVNNPDISGFDTSNVTNMSWMFFDSGLSNCDLSNFDTSKVTNMSLMFGSDNNTTLDLSNFDTSNVTNMHWMLISLTKLNTLILGPKWNFLPENELGKAWMRDGDYTIYTAEELTNTYDGSTMAGTYRAYTAISVVEQIKGPLADTNKYFDFHINVQRNNIGINGNHDYYGTNTGSINFVDGNASFRLKHNEELILYFPMTEEHTYTVTQEETNYTLEKTNDTGNTSMDNDVIFTNTLDGTTPTGIILNLIPYILIIIIIFFYF